jgi:glycosyltransferase involved in cell wall biosynthesis
VKILMVSPYWDPVTGGGERVLKRSSLAMRDRGHHVDILTLNTDAAMRGVWAREDLLWEGLRVTRWPVLNLVPASPQGSGRLIGRFQNRLFPWKYVMKYFYAPGFARQARGYDIVQLHNDIEVGFLWLLRHVHTPRLLWCHTLDVTYKLHYQHHRLTRELLRHSADYFLTGCTSTIEPLRAMGVPAERIGTIHYGVDETTFHPEPSLREPRTILFVGALQAHKGGVMLLRALRHLRRPARVVLLTISRDPGYGKEFARLLQEEEARGFHSFEHVPDMRDQPRLVRYYQSATVFATPSLESVFELVNLEALACGTPVVASRVGGFPDLIAEGENGFLVPPGDPAALAARLEQVLDDPALAVRLGEAGRRTILRDFTWGRVGEKLESCYRRLLAPRPGVDPAR